MSMRRVIKFVELKVTEKIIDRDYFEYDEITSLMNDGGVTTHDDALVLLNRLQPINTTVKVNRKILPISVIHGAGKPDIHIVYSPEVSELFDKPINIIIEENYHLRTSLGELEKSYIKLRVEHSDLKIKTSTFWRRLKNLF